MPEDRSCWTCASQNISSPTTFLGNCTCPAPNNPTRCKPIPPEIVGKGCGRWTEKKVEQTQTQEASNA